MNIRIFNKLISLLTVMLLLFIATNNWVLADSKDLLIQYFDSGNKKALSEDYKGALSDFNNAIEYEAFVDNENKSKLYASRGAAKYYLEDYEGAFNDCEQALKYNPKNKTAKNVIKGIQNRPPDFSPLFRSF